MSLDRVFQGLCNGKLKVHVSFVKTTSLRASFSYSFLSLLYRPLKK